MRATGIGAMLAAFKPLGVAVSRLRRSVSARSRLPRGISSDTAHNCCGHVLADAKQFIGDGDNGANELARTINAEGPGTNCRGYASGD